MARYTPSPDNAINLTIPMPRDVKERLDRLANAAQFTTTAVVRAALTELAAERPVTLAGAVGILEAASAVAKADRTGPHTARPKSGRKRGPAAG